MRLPNSLVATIFRRSQKEKMSGLWFFLGEAPYLKKSNAENMRNHTSPKITWSPLTGSIKETPGKGSVLLKHDSKKIYKKTTKNLPNHLLAC